MYVCTPCMCLKPTEVRRGHQIPLDLELQMVVSCHMGAGNKPVSFTRTATLNP